jgi:hypothetical protein
VVESEFGFKNVPLGALHVALVAEPPIVPEMASDPPWQIVKEGPAYTVGAGFTRMVKVRGGPGQLTAGFPPVNMGVTVIVATCTVFVVLTAVKNGIFPVPLAANPIEGLLFVQE